MFYYNHSVRTRNISSILLSLYSILAEGPGVAGEKKVLKKNVEKLLKNNFKHPRPTLSDHKQFSPIRSSRFAGYRQHIYIQIYECLVYYINIKFSNTNKETYF